MTMLVDAAHSLLTPELVSRGSAETGESNAAVSKGLGAVIPMLFASLSGRSDDRGFMSQVANLATKTFGERDVTRTEVTAYKIDSTTPTGGWLSSLFGGGLGSVVDGVGRYAGVKSSSASSLLAMATPLVLGYLGRLMRSDNLDASGLAARLRTERQSLASAVPHELDSYVPGVAKPVERARYAEHVARPERTRARVPWVLPLILAGLGLLGLLWWLGSANRARIETATTRLPGNVELRVPPGGMEDRLVGYLRAPTPGAVYAFDFDRIGFQTASASLTGVSREQLDNIARILKAYPNAQVVIAGYTDNTGNEADNLELSRSRAVAVMNGLTQRGVASERIRAEGYGSQNPVADNATEAGRARNRRVTMQVTSS